MVDTSTISSSSLKDYLIVDLYSMDWKKPALYTKRRIMELFYIHERLSKDDCEEILSAEYRFKGGISSTSISDHFDALEEIGILKRTGPQSMSTGKKGAKYYRLTTFGIFYSIINGSGRGLDTDILELVKKNLDDKLFTHFLYPYITKGTIVELKDYKVINIICDFLKTICQNIVTVFDRFDELKRYGGVSASYFMTRYFEDPGAFYEMAGPKDFVNTITKMFSIQWQDIEKVKLISLVPFGKYKITDGKRILLLKIDPKKKMALLTEQNTLICRFMIEEEFEDTYHLICPIVPMELEEYFDKYLVENVIQNKTFESFCYDIVNMSKDDQILDILLLYRDLRFKHILDVYTEVESNRYNMLIKFHNLYNQ